VFEPKDFGKLRKQMGITQSELARLAGVSQSLVAKVEAGRIDPSFSKAKALSEALLRLQHRTLKKAGDIMVGNVIHVEKDAHLRDAVKLMQKHAISQLPVYESGRPVGSISERAAIRLLASSSNTEQAFQLSVRDVMEETFPSVSPDAPVEVLYPLLDFFPAALVMKRGLVMGIITKADLLKAH
jgi:predicted transcriptional regulator